MGNNTEPHGEFDWEEARARFIAHAERGIAQCERAEALGVDTGQRREMYARGIASMRSADKAARKPTQPTTRLRGPRKREHRAGPSRRRRTCTSRDDGDSSGSSDPHPAPSGEEVGGSRTVPTDKTVVGYHGDIKTSKAVAA